MKKVDTHGQARGPFKQRSLLDSPLARRSIRPRLKAWSSGLRRRWGSTQRAEASERGRLHPALPVEGATQAPIKDKQIAVLISGGLDSCVLLSDLSQKYARVFPLYIKNGLLWEGVELYWLRKFLKAISQDKDSIQEIAILNLPVQDLYHGHWSLTGHRVPDYRSDDPSVYLPGRNLLLLTKATLFCAMNGIGTLALGPLKGNPFPDSSKTFFRSFGKAASQGLDFPISIITPYRALSKEDVILRGRSLPLELTFSCIQPIGRYHCGMCNKCAERQKAFKNAGISDKTIYKSHWPRRG